MEDQARSIAQALQREFAAYETEHAGGPKINYGDWELDWAKSHFFGLRAREDGSIVFNGNLWINQLPRPGEGGGGSLPWDPKPATFTMPLSSSVKNAGFASETTYSKPFKFEPPSWPSPFPIPSSVLVKGLGSQKYASGSGFPHTVDFSISIPASLQREIEEYHSAYMGFPSRGQGGFARMFYLSTVTITTLGYGDIVPMTTRARLLVSLESILGLAVMGLFVATVLAATQRKTSAEAPNKANSADAKSRAAD